MAEVLAQSVYCFRDDGDDTSILYSWLTNEEIACFQTDTGRADLQRWLATLDLHATHDAKYGASVQRRFSMEANALWSDRLWKLNSAEEIDIEHLLTDGDRGR